MLRGFSDIVLNLLCFSLSLLANHLWTVPLIVNFSRNITNYWLFVLLVDFRCSMWDGETLWCALTLCVRRNIQTTSNIFFKVWCCKEFSFFHKVTIWNYLPFICIYSLFYMFSLRYLFGKIKHCAATFSYKLIVYLLFLNSQDIVIGTPGRLKDLMEMGICCLNEVSFVVSVFVV